MHRKDHKYSFFLSINTTIKKPQTCEFENENNQQINSENDQRVSRART